MRIEAYFQRLRDLVDACPVVQSSSITYDKRSTHEGFIRGELYFVDASVLHVREFVDVEMSKPRWTGCSTSINTWIRASNCDSAMTTPDVSVQAADW